MKSRFWESNGNRTHTFRRSFIALFLTIPLAACGGGGGSAPSLTSPLSNTTPQTPPTTSSMGTAQVSITIPTTAAQSTTRSEQYVSTATNSLTMSSNGGAPAVISLSTYPGCTTSASGRTCVIQMSLPTGAASFTIRTYASADGTGSALSIGSGTTTVLANANNPINLKLDAIVSSLNVALTLASLVGLQAASNAVFVSAYDAANAAIPLANNTLVDQNDAPVSIGLTDTDPSGATTIAPATLGSAPEMVTYTGATIPSSVTIAAVAKNSSNAIIASAAVPLAFSSASGVPITTSTSPSASPPGVVLANLTSLAFTAIGTAAAQSFVVSESNYGGTFTASASGGDPTVVSIGVSGNSITVTPNQPGSTNVVVTGGNGNFVSIPVSTTSTSITIQ